MDWVESKSVRCLCPDLAEVFVGREAFERLESSGEVVGSEEVVQVRFELVVGVVKVALHRSVLDGSVHALDLPVGPGMVGFGKPVLDSVDMADAVEGVAAKTCGWALTVLRQVGELDSVVGEYGVDTIWNGFDERLEERGGSLHICSFDEFDHSELRGSVDGHEQVELAFGRSHLSQVDVEEADRIGVELLPASLVPLNLGQAADAMAFQTTMKRRACELRDRGLKSIEAVVERQKRVLAKRHDDGFLFDRQNRRPRNGGTGPAIGSGLALLPLGDGLLVDAMTPGQCPHALLTMLYRSTDRLCRCGAPV
jgi:hypothetical protein